MRLVRLVRRACRILVFARVLLSFCAWAMSGAAEQSDTRGTVRPARGPVSQRQASLGLPVLVLLNTIRCSVTNSLALICCQLHRLFGNNHMHILGNDRSFRHCTHAHNVPDVGNDYISIVCKLIPWQLSNHKGQWLGSINIID